MFWNTKIQYKAHLWANLSMFLWRRVMHPSQSVNIIISLGRQLLHWHTKSKRWWIPVYQDCNEIAGHLLPPTPFPYPSVEVPSTLNWSARNNAVCWLVNRMVTSCATKGSMLSSSELWSNISQTHPFFSSIFHCYMKSSLKHRYALRSFVYTLHFVIPYIQLWFWNQQFQFCVIKVIFYSLCNFVWYHEIK